MVSDTEAAQNIEKWFRPPAPLPPPLLLLQPALGQGAREAVLPLDLGARQLHSVLVELTAGRAPPLPCALRSTGSRTTGGEGRFPLGKTYFRLHS